MLGATLQAVHATAILLGIWLPGISAQLPTPRTTAPISRASPSRTTSCFGIGDTITVTGTYLPVIGSNFSLYEPRTKGLCAHYPKRTDHMPITSLDVNVAGGPIKDINLPQHVYLEVTGVLTDLYPQFSPLGFKVISFRNVDTEVKAEISDWTQHCNEWQDGQLAIIGNKLHGGNVARTTDALGRKCGITGYDAQLPHDVIGPIWRREP